ncbi:MAG: hypothetical protein K2X93_11270 [Candidatus Obscuribacterales bacterium]|nr:hypothetical protein [Candidatus Obscuribacterales bacterium]
MTTPTTFIQYPEMEISATELKQRLDRGDKIVLLDIRKPFELQIACLDNVVHIPEEEIENRLDELKQFENQDIVVYCRTGRRSTELTQILEGRGFSRIFNLTGGLHAWSDDVDPAVMKY